MTLSSPFLCTSTMSNARSNSSNDNGSNQMQMCLVSPDMLFELVFISLLTIEYLQVKLQPQLLVVHVMSSPLLCHSPLPALQQSCLRPNPTCPPHVAGIAVHCCPYRPHQCHANVPHHQPAHMETRARSQKLMTQQSNQLN